MRKAMSSDSMVSVGSMHSRSGVPEEVRPYLHRIQTKDIQRYMEAKGKGEKEKKNKQFSAQSCAKKILNIPHFDTGMAVVILLNVIVMVFEVNRIASEGEESSRVLHWTEVIGWVVLVIFVVELIVRLLAEKLHFFQDAWNAFDAIIVSVDCIFSLISLFFGHIFPLSVLRVFRLAKLVRAFKVLRVFPELRLMLAGLFSSISAIFWGTLLLFFCMLMWAMVAVLFIHPLNKNIDYVDCDRCSRAYSSVMHSVMTFWQTIVTGDSWGAATIPIIEEYPATAVFFVAVYLSVGMAVTNLILGVVVNVASQTVHALAEEDDAQTALAKLDLGTNLLQICQEMDTDHNGELSREELFTALETPGEFRDTIHSLGISKEEFDIVWTILDEDKSGEVSYKELIKNLSLMKNSDSQFMLSYIKYYMTILLQKLRAETESFERKVVKDLEIIEQREEEILEEEEELLDMMERKVGNNEENTTADPQVKHHHHHHHLRETKATSVFDSRREKTTQIELDNFCEEIAKMRTEITGILINMDRKLGLQDPRLAAMEVDMTSTKAQSDLPAAPTKSISKACETFITSRKDRAKVSSAADGPRSAAGAAPVGAIFKEPLCQCV